MRDLLEKTLNRFEELERQLVDPVILGDSPKLTAAIRAVHRGDAVLAPSVTRRLVDRLRAAPPAAEEPAPSATDPTAELTDRERDVFVAIAHGMNNAEIAHHLFLSESTVKTHVGRVLAKIGARDRVHAVILAHRHRLVDVSAPPAPDGQGRSTT